MIEKKFEYQGITINDTETWLDYKKPYASVDFFYEGDVDAEFNLAFGISFCVEVNILPEAAKENDIEGSDLSVTNVFIYTSDTDNVLLSDTCSIFREISNHDDLLQRIAEAIQAYNVIYQQEVKEQIEEDAAFAKQEANREALL